MSVRLGAVGYLNARPLVAGLERQADRFTVRFDTPSQCAALLHGGQIDVGLIPSIEYLQRPDYRIVPSIAIASQGAVASVALFTRTPRTRIRSIALDSGSRTSAVLLKVLCHERFRVSPEFVTMAPDLRRMLQTCDAAMLIGDAALFLECPHAGLENVEKIDLGVEWYELTGLPFVWAFWAGPEVGIGKDVVGALQAARDAGVTGRDEIAAAYCRGDAERIARGQAYLRENIQFQLGPAEATGLRCFFEAAARLGLAPGDGILRFCAESDGGRPAGSKQPDLPQDWTVRRVSSDA